MKKITLEQFLASPEQLIRDAALGEYLTVSTGRGLNAVIIEEEEWIILRQAFTLCMELSGWKEAKK